MVGSSGGAGKAGGERIRPAGGGSSILMAGGGCDVGRGFRKVEAGVGVELKSIRLGGVQEFDQAPIVFPRSHRGLAHCPGGLKVGASATRAVRGSAVRSGEGRLWGTRASDRTRPGPAIRDAAETPIAEFRWMAGLRRAN